ncbi:hypothetical protein ACWDYH_00550 [Nocardia goodfellowii]
MNATQLIAALSKLPGDAIPRVYIPDRDYGDYWEEVIGAEISKYEPGYVDLESEDV